MLPICPQRRIRFPTAQAPGADSCGRAQARALCRRDEYAILVALSEAPDRRLRMSELADVSGLSRSRVTRVVDNLVARPLVTRADVAAR